MQLSSRILDGALEVGEAMLNPSLVGLPNAERLGGVLVLGVAAMFIGIARTIEPVLGKTVSVAVGLILTLALFSEPSAVPLAELGFLLMSAVLKLASGAAFGSLMARSARFALAGALLMCGTALGVSQLLPSLDLDAIQALKLAIVIVSGIGTYDLMQRSGAFGRYPNGPVLGISIGVAAVGLVDSAAFLASDPALAFLSRFANVAFGSGVALGIGARVLGCRRANATLP